MNSIFLQSLRERELYLNVSRGTFLDNPLIGIGAGQFIPDMIKNYSFESWQYQPVHNVFLLIINEFGIIGLALFVFFIYKILYFNKIVPRGTIHVMNGAKVNGNVIVYFKALLIVFLFVMLFDHYLWDIQQGQIIFWLTLGLLVSFAEKEINIYNNIY